MTQVTVLERAVIRNVALIQLAATALVSQVSEGPESIKQNQVGAVLLNLKRKGLVVQESSTVVALTDAGLEVHAREFPSAKSLEELRHASNVELAKEKPMTLAELSLVNNLIGVRKASLKISQRLEALKLALTEQPQEESELVAA